MLQFFAICLVARMGLGPVFGTRGHRRNLTRERAGGFDLAQLATPRRSIFGEKARVFGPMRRRTRGRRHPTAAALEYRTTHRGFPLWGLSEFADRGVPGIHAPCC